MSYPVYYVPAGDVLPIFFDTFAGSTGASITMTGLAVTDIEIYKDGSATQRASDAGYTLLDTDGIDFDTITGIHGFSVDTGDNTDAGFYTVGAWFHVVVSAITVDSQTVSFVAAAFRIMEAETTAGRPLTQTAAISANAITATSINADAITDAKVAADVTIASVTGSVGSVTAGVSVGAGGITATSFAAGAIDAAAIAADAIGASELAQGAAQEIADEVLNRNLAGGGSGNTRNVRNALRSLRNKSSIAAGTLTVTEEDDTTTAWTAAVTTAAGDPISSIDPA